MIKQSIYNQRKIQIQKKKPKHLKTQT